MMHHLRHGFIAVLCIAFAVACSAPLRQPASAPLRTVTLNIYHDKADWPLRRELVLARLRELSPDVIAMQEVIGHGTVRNQASDIAAELGYHVAFVSTDGVDKPRRYGNAILTRGTIVRQEEIFLRPLADSRTALHVATEWNGSPLDIYVTHLNYLNDANGVAMRDEQVADLGAFINRTAGKGAVILAGDFNTAIDSRELQPLLDKFRSSYDLLHPDALKDKDAHSTLNLNYFPQDRRRIDHILFDPAHLRPVNSNRLFTEPNADGIWATDHYGVMTDFVKIP